MHKGQRYSSLRSYFGFQFGKSFYLYFTFDVLFVFLNGLELILIYVHFEKIFIDIDIIHGNGDKVIISDYRRIWKIFCF